MPQGSNGETGGQLNEEGPEEWPQGERAPLTQEEEAMVETIWGAASFSSSSSVVDVCVPKVSVSPCSAELFHNVCCRAVRERPGQGPEAGTISPSEGHRSTM